MNLRYPISILALLLILSSAGWADNENSDSTQLQDADRAFLDSAANADRTEIELSRLAFAKSVTPGVRTFAQQMIGDHDRNLRDLQSLSDQKHYVIAPEVDAGHRQVLRKLQAGKGDDAFDRTYLETMVADHTDMDGLLDRTANSTNDGDIKKFASDTLITVRKHTQMARDLGHQ